MMYVSRIYGVFLGLIPLVHDTWVCMGRNCLLQHSPMHMDGMMYCTVLYCTLLYTCKALYRECDPRVDVSGPYQMYFEITSTYVDM